MADRGKQSLISGTKVTSLGTLVSRVLGMLRDMATASLLGLSGGGVMDAFVIAFRIPNLFRRLFGEGALAASYLPVLSAKLEEQDRRAAWRLVSVVFTWLTLLLALLVLWGEAICWLIGAFWGDTPGVSLLVGLAAVMLPYMLLICLAAQMAATLHALSHFGVPALVPTVLNIGWLFGALVIAPRFAPDREAQAYVLAVSILIAGLVQVGVQLPVLRAKGFRFDYDWQASRVSVLQIVRAMGPMIAGLMVTQINTLLDSLIAWGLARSPHGPERIAWLADRVGYPMEQGAAAAVYYGERLYQFPLGILGIAVATAIFPLLSRRAARGDRRRLGTDLTLGLRLVLCLGVPASVGLVILAEPLARLLFQRGQFTAHDALRTARMIGCYAGGVWAYCAIPVVVRGYYALGDRITPVKIGSVAVGVNLTLNLLLIWPLAEAGLAVATSVAAAVQLLLLLAAFSRRQSSLGWPSLATTTVRAIAATLPMGLAAYAILRWIPSGVGLTDRLMAVFVPLIVGLAVYTATYRALGGREIRMLLGGIDEKD